MLKSCQYCGRIHDSKYNCGRKPVHRKKGTDRDKFHSSHAWTTASIDIRRRDKYLCQACLHNLDGNGIRYTTDDLSVHHIDPLETGWDKRLDWDNLITLCSEHHEMAETGHIGKDALFQAAERNNQDWGKE